MPPHTERAFLRAPAVTLRVAAFFATVLRPVLFFAVFFALRLVTAGGAARLRTTTLLRGAFATAGGLALFAGAGVASDSCATMRRAPESPNFTLTGLPPHISSRP